MRCLVPLHTGDGVRTFGLVEVAADFGYAQRLEEVGKGIGVGQRVGGDHRNGMERDAVRAQPGDAAQRARVAAVAAPGDAVLVVQDSWSVDADPHLYRVALEQRTAGVVDQRGVGLDRVADHAAGAGEAAHRLEGLVVESRWHRQRLAGVPDDGETVAQQAIIDQVLDRVLHHGQRHARAVVALGQVAVVAADVAERRGLQHQQPGAQPRLEVGEAENSGGSRPAGGPAVRPAYGVDRAHAPGWFSQCCGL